MKIEANASKRGQRLLADYAEQKHFRANEVWSIEANASKRGQKEQKRAEKSRKSRKSRKGKITANG